MVMTGDDFGCHAGGASAGGMWLVEARDPAKFLNCPMHSSPYNKKLFSPRCHQYQGQETLVNKS